MKWVPPCHVEGRKGSQDGAGRLGVVGGDLPHIRGQSLIYILPGAGMGCSWTQHAWGIGEGGAVSVEI